MHLSKINSLFIITNHQLPITNHQSPITNYQSPITNHQLPITNVLTLSKHRSIIKTEVLEAFIVDVTQVVLVFELVVELKIIVPAFAA